jgi:hypothetical protein
MSAEEWRWTSFTYVKKYGQAQGFDVALSNRIGVISKLLFPCLKIGSKNKIIYNLGISDSILSYNVSLVLYELKS